MLDRLPDLALARVLQCLSPRDLGNCRVASKAWRDAVAVATENLTVVVGEAGSKVPRLAEIAPGVRNLDIVLQYNVYPTDGMTVLASLLEGLSTLETLTVRNGPLATGCADLLNVDPASLPQRGIHVDTNTACFDEVVAPRLETLHAAYMAGPLYLCRNLVSLELMLGDVMWRTRLEDLQEMPALRRLTLGYSSYVVAGPTALQITRALGRRLTGALEHLGLTGFAAPGDWGDEIVGHTALRSFTLHNPLWHREGFTATMPCGLTRLEVHDPVDGLVAHMTALRSLAITDNSKTRTVALEDLAGLTALEHLTTTNFHWTMSPSQVGLVKLPRLTSLEAALPFDFSVHRPKCLDALSLLARSCPALVRVAVCGPDVDTLCWLMGIHRIELHAWPGWVGTVELVGGAGGRCALMMHRCVV